MSTARAVIAFYCVAHDGGVDRGEHESSGGICYVIVHEMTDDASQTPQAVRGCSSSDQQSSTFYASGTRRKRFLLEPVPYARTASRGSNKHDAAPRAG